MYVADSRASGPVAPASAEGTARRVVAGRSRTATAGPTARAARPADAREATV